MNKHQCIKPTCDNHYEDKEPEAYYCHACREANKALAKEIDAKVASRPNRSSKSLLDSERANGQTKHEPDGTEVLVIRA